MKTLKERLLDRECLNAPHRKNSGRTSSAYWAARRAGATA